MSTAALASAISAPTNGAKEAIESEMPYVALVTIEGVADLLFHGWNVEAVQGKADAKKGSKAKKTDDVESFVYRTKEANSEGKGYIAIPSEYLRMSVVNAAKF